MTFYFKYAIIFLKKIKGGKIIFGNNFYGYEHALKVSIEKKGKKKINEVMIQDLFSDKEKSIFKLSEMD